MANAYSLLIQNIEGITKIPGLHGTPKLFVKVHLDGSLVLVTGDGESTLSPRWNYSGNLWEVNRIMIYANSWSRSADLPTDKLTLEVYHNSFFGLNPLIGKCDTTIGELLRESAASTGKSDDFGSASGRIFLRLSPVSSQDLHESASRGVQQMSADVQKVVPSSVDSSHIMGVADAAVKAKSMADDFQPLLSQLLSQLKPIVDIGDEIATIHPYINIAWMVLTSQVMEKQRDADEKIAKLVQAMVKLYSSVGDIGFLRSRINTLENVVLEIAAQTVECSHFIREYTGHGFSGRLLRNTFSGTAKKIQELSEVLMKLKDSFDQGIVVQSVFLSAEIQDRVQGLIESDLLNNKLRPAQYNAAVRTGCLEGTRKELLTEITVSLSSCTNTSNIFWLHGVAGSGKSTIANTVSHYFRSLHRLGAFIFFDRDYSCNSDVRGVLHHIAHRLAESNMHVRKALCDALSADATLVDADYRTQFQKLLLDPLTVAAPYSCGPTVIIVDALDECLDCTSRQALVSLIAGDMAKLPAAFRFLITSRPDSDIVRSFHLKPHISSRQLDITTEEPQWPGDDNIQLLATYSGGLFIWAAAAYKFLKTFDPPKRLEQLLKAGGIIHDDLDQLYNVALHHAGDWANANFSSAAQAVLAWVVLSREPLTAEALNWIMGLGQEDLQVTKVLEFLGCVLQWGPGIAISTLHGSFSDYLTDPKRSGSKAWFIDIILQSQVLTMRCFQVLATKLKFNICHIETSHLRNSDIPDLAERIERYILVDVRYASRYWAHHLHLAATSPAMLDALKQFTSKHFLFWLEVLSLLGLVSGAHEALEIAKNYAQAKDQGLASFLQDGMKFVAGFAPAIALSMPHLYVSALAMAPQTSAIREHYRRNHTIKYEAPSVTGWSSLLMVLPGEDVITTVAFSHDSSRVVSGSEDCMVRIWDSRTGAIVAGPFKGHSSWVSSVAFSHDSTRVVSGSGDCTVRIWDSQTGTIVAGPFEGHSNPINSVAFSHDSTCVVSGSGDGTVRIWDSQTGAVIAGPFQGHSDRINSVAFSHDSTHVVSGSGDGTVRIWDAKSGVIAAGPFEGHTDAISSVAFSPDSTRVVSGSGDFTVRIWDSQTGAVVAGPCKGHRDRIISVAFSHDGTNVVSGSYDCTAYIWDSKTGAIVAGPFEGHSDRISSVAFSHDSSRIVSGSSDCTVRIWDSQTDVVPVGLLEAHTDWVSSVAFSHDSTWVASGSSDRTVRIWNAQTGASVARPFEGHSDRISSVAFSHDSRHVVSGSRDRTLRIWDSQTGAHVAGPFEGHRNWISSVAFSHESSRIVSGSDDCTVRIWDSQTGALVAGPFSGHRYWITSVAFSHDSTRVVSGSGDWTLRIWDSRTGAVTGPFEGHTDAISSVAFSHDSTRVVSGSSDYTVRIWDSQTGALVAPPFEGHRTWISSVAFSHDSTRIVSGSGDCTVCVWDSTTGAIIAGPFEGHHNWVSSVAFSHDSTRVVSGSGDCTVRIWDCHPDVGKEHISQTDKLVARSSSSSDTRPLHQASDITWGLHPRFVDGWIMNSASDLIIWVPPWLRDQTCLPWNICVIGSRVCNLDWSDFVHGRQWNECFTPRNWYAQSARQH
ncbi:WD40 repeat-like protein [Favolaschia claudopus]|uniref:WD40 repeat-like protein n=1 Tax=Favolaschia claudopus TaxID=2862362 RepID=A0AAV9ZR06_9AGAR